MGTDLKTLRKYIDEIGLEVPDLQMAKAARNCLTVGELIKELEQYDPELPVLLNVNDNIVDGEGSFIDATVSEGPLLDTGTYLESVSDEFKDYIVVLSSCAWKEMLESDKLFPKMK
jgi:hypothetical protein